MRTAAAVVLASVMLMLPVTAPAQNFNNWNKVDTVTAGACDDLNPSLMHNAFSRGPSDFIRMVFERHTSTSSGIAAMRYDLSTREQSRWVSIFRRR